MKKKQYFYLQDENEEYWFELDDKNCAIRQIIKDSKNIFHLSCFEDCLAEESVSDLSFFKVISYDIFQTIWNKFLYVHNLEWENIKKTHTLGSYVDLRVEYFYPQGIIMKNDNITAIYKGNSNFALHENVYMKVTQYDNENHWVVVM